MTFDEITKSGVKSENGRRGHTRWGDAARFADGSSLINLSRRGQGRFNTSQHNFLLSNLQYALHCIGFCSVLLLTQFPSYTWSQITGLRLKCNSLCTNFNFQKSISRIFSHLNLASSNNNFAQKFCAAVVTSVGILVGNCEILAGCLHTLLQSDGIGLGADVNKFLPKLLLPQFLHAKKGFPRRYRYFQKISLAILRNCTKLRKLQQDQEALGWKWEGSWVCLSIPPGCSSLHLIQQSRDRARVELESCLMADPQVLIDLILSYI